MTARTFESNDERKAFIAEWSADRPKLSVAAVARAAGNSWTARGTGPDVSKFTGDGTRTVVTLSQNGVEAAMHLRDRDPATVSECVEHMQSKGYDAVAVGLMVYVAKPRTEGDQ